MRTYPVNNLFYPALILIVCFIAYLPLSTFLFAPKNDAYIYNFPNKFFFTECLKNGYLPTWNPYLNFGFPLHADPGFAWWHPLTWIFGLIGYNAYTFSVEILLYIYIGGLGMYWLGKSLHLNQRTAFAMACMFMCSGFFIGNLQHINFLTAAAFIPWFTCSWLLYQQSPTNKHLFYCGLSAYLLFTAGHPAIPIGTIYFFIGLSIIYFLFFHEKIGFLAFIANQTKLLLCILIFLFPLIYSYISILPYYSRSEAVNQLESIHVGFTLPSYLSFFLPFATIRDNGWFSTDVSMRNAYFSLLGVFCLFNFILKKEKEKLPYIFLILGMCMLVISMGGIVKEVVYQHLPGLQLIRTNGEYRVFSIFCFVICAAYPLNLLLTNNSIGDLSKTKVFSWLILLILILTITFSISFPTSSLENGSLIESIKLFLAQLTFRESFIIALFVALGLSAFYWASLKTRKTFEIVIFVLIIDLVINSWLVLPITGVGKTSVATMQSTIDKSAEGFPSPSLEKRIVNSKMLISSPEASLIGNWAWYDKEIMHSVIDYPSQLKSTIKFLGSKDSTLLFERPYIYLKHKDVEGLEITSFSPNAIKASVTIIQADTLMLFQNDFKGWEVKINYDPAQYISCFGTFMAVPLSKGIYKIEWRYSPSIMKILFIWIILFTVSTAGYKAFSTRKLKPEHLPFKGKI